MMKVVEGQPGQHIRDVIDAALREAQRERETVILIFNGTEMLVEPESSIAGLRAKWERLTGHKVLDAEEEAEKARQGLEKQQAEWDRAIREAGVPDEEELRDMDAPWPKSLDELTEFIRSMVDRPHSYGTCPYATSLAAVAAFYYVASQLGITGFQASCADLDVLRRTRHLEGPFAILNARKLLYPQYNLYQDACRLIDEWKPWAAEEARKELAENPEAHPNVIAHWRRLAEHESGE